MRLSDAEWCVMRPIWEHGEATARTVLDAVGELRNWAYTTVKTILDRLVDKGVLAASKRGKTHVYTAKLTEAEARRRALQAVADSAFDGAFAPMLRFMAADQPLSKKQRTALRALLDEESRR